MRGGTIGDASLEPGVLPLLATLLVVLDRPIAMLLLDHASLFALIDGSFHARLSETRLLIHVLFRHYSKARFDSHHDDD